MKQKHHFLLIIQTFRYLKIRQLYYQVYYRIFKGQKKLNSFSPSTIKKQSTLIQLSPSPVSAATQQSFKIEKEDFRFSFLNLTHSFSKQIDWNYASLGTLWTYNLTYFDFLFSSGCSLENGLFLIHDFISKISKVTTRLDPYPISLRNINWIKFLIYHQINDFSIIQSLRQQYELLYHRLEFHLMGNHLLENGFSLLFGGYYLQEEKFFKKGKQLTIKELSRQILPDGGHFEQSPMYHQIILHRLLDVINLFKNKNAFFDQVLNDILCSYASSMLAWMKNITFSDGTFPCFNDASREIARTADQLLRYAANLDILPKINLHLKESGYRMWKKADIECCFDIGNISASYQPGHAHADTFTFCLHYKKKPVIIDTGISTYEKNERRQMERSTISHNTVVIDELNSSEVWSGFRLAKRAKVQIKADESNSVTAIHDGYRTIGCIHQRKFYWQQDEFIIEDDVQGSAAGKNCFSYLHFHPGCKIVMQKNKLIINEGLIIEFTGFESLSLESYYFCEGFNCLKEASKLKGWFSNNSVIRIKPLN